MKSIFICISFIFGILLTGCHTYSFIPQTQNVPLFDGAEQLKINSVLTYRSIEFQVAGSPVNHLGIMMNGMLREHASMAEAGIGYFYPVQESLLLEVYGGYGRGNLHYDSLNETQSGIFGTSGYYNRAYDIKADRFFLQPNIGYRFNENVELALSLKTCYWSFPKYYKDVEYWSKDDAGGYSYTRTFKDSVNILHGNQVTYEPAITLKAGGKMVKFMAQGGIYFYMDEAKGSLKPYNDFPIFVRLGVTVCIDFKEFGKRD